MKKNSLFQLCLAWFALCPMVGADDAAQILQKWEKNPQLCNRAQLLEFLRSDDVRIRSSAVDFLESVTGDDFGLDPWLAPHQVPEPIQQRLRDWGAVEASLGAANVAPTPEQIRETVAILRTADADTARRICLRYAAFPQQLAYAIEQEIEANPDMCLPERDSLHFNQYRVYLQSAMSDDAVSVAVGLTSHVRRDTTDALEKLREVGQQALPVVMDFVYHSDILVREVAVDVLLEIGKTSAFDILMKDLMAEKDRNILQIAARRAMDCKPTPQIIAFLCQCALSDDEDISISGLEALGDLAEQVAERDDGISFVNIKSNTSKKQSASTPSEGLTDEHCKQLIQSPHWRVRAATLTMLSHHAPFLPSLLETDLRQCIVACLKDPDESVRQAAAVVIYSRGMINEHMDALTEYALSSPTMAPYVVYLYLEKKQELPPALMELMKRFTLGEMIALKDYSDKYKSLFADSDSGRKYQKTVLLAMLENPDPQVLSMLMLWRGDMLLRLSDETAEHVFRWLENPSVAFLDKMEMIEDGSFYELDSSIQKRLQQWIEQQLENPELKQPSQRLVLLKEYMRYRYDTPVDMIQKYVGPSLLELPAEELEEYLIISPSLFCSLDVEILNTILNNSELRVHSRLNVLHHAVQSQSKLNFDELKLPPDLCVKLLAELTDNVDYVKHNDYVCGVVHSLLRSCMSESATQKQKIVAVLILNAIDSVADESLKTASAALLETIPASEREYVECVNNMPLKADEFEPWVRKFYQSENVQIRKFVAASLLPLDAMTPGVFIGEQYVRLNHRFERAQLKRVTCPVSLIRLIQDMQKDENDSVAAIACASMLYRTGDCDRERFLSITEQWSKLYDERMLVEELEPKLPLEMEADMDTICYMWKRWSDYRHSVEEPFKLKGSPKTLKPGVDVMLKKLSELFHDNTYSLIEPVQSLIRSVKDSEEEESTAPASAYVFSAPQTQQPESSEPVVSDESADVDEGDILKLDRNQAIRVEFFHTKNCDVCKEALRHLDMLRQTYPKLNVVTYDIDSQEGIERNLVLCERFQVAAQQRRKAPALFAEGGYLLGEKIATSALHELMDATLAGTPVGDKLAEKLPQQEETPAVSSEPVPVMLADTTVQEQTAVAEESRWEQIKGYAVLAGGVLAVLFALLFPLFRKKSEAQDES